MRDLAIQLKDWRLSKGLSTVQLARLSGIPRPNLAALEQGKRECTLKTLRYLAAALGISPGIFLDESPPPSVTLNRHERDSVIRYLFNLTDIADPKILHAAKILAPLLKPTLQMLGKRLRIRGKRGNRASSWEARVVFGDDTFKELINRSNKFAAGSN